MFRQTRRTGLKGQRGAETVEFALTLVLFMLVFFMIVDFALATYNRGVVLQAAREASRQGSLYWVDPAVYNPLTPLQNQRLKRAMVTTMEDWYQGILVDPGGSGIDLTLEINDLEITDATVVVNGDANVSVDLSYEHSYIGLDVLASSSGFTLDVRSGAGVE
jgi:hypothetical protein